MKSKKSLRIISALVGLIATLTAFSGISVLADDAVYSVKGGELYERAACSAPVDYVVDADGAAIESSKISAVKVTSVDGTITYESGVKGEGGKGYIYSDGKITYYYSENLESGNQDEYKVTVTVKTGDDSTQDFTATVKVCGKVSDGLNYKTAADIDALRAADDFLSVSGTSSSRKLKISYDKLSTIIESKYVDASLLKYTVYYQSPSSSTYTSTTEKTGSLADVSLSEEGTYRFYVIVKDVDGNGLLGVDAEGEAKTVSDLDMRADGYYESEETDAKLVLPIFSYDYEKEDADKQVSVVKNDITGKNAKGRVNQRYQSVTFEVKNAAYSQFTLKYRANDASEWKDAENGVEAKFTASSFTASQLYFTPLKKGQFKFEAKVKANDSADNLTVTADSDIVTVNEEVEELKLVNENLKNFFKNNWLSVVFLGIAVLCLVGIVVVAFWKPKDAEKSTEEPKKQEETIVADDSQIAELKESATQEPSVQETMEEEQREEVEETSEEVTEESVENGESVEEDVQPESNDSEESVSEESKPE